MNMVRNSAIELTESQRSQPFLERSSEDDVNMEVARITLVNARREVLSSPENKPLRPLPGTLRITVQRELIVEQSLRCLCAVPFYDLLATSLSITFKGEDGYDAGGLTRDWFDSLGQGLMAFAQRDGALAFAQDRTLVPRPLSPKFEELYAIGRLAGLAVWFGNPLPVPLSSVFCKLLLNEPVSHLDLQRLDPEFYQFRVRPVIKPGGVSELEAALGEPLMFVSAATDLRPTPRELCAGGATMQVTDANKKEYIRLLCEDYLCGDMHEQLAVLLKGFREIVPSDTLICAGLSYRDVALLICGYADIDAKVWREHTAYENKNEHSTGQMSVVEWFWEFVEASSSEIRAKLLHFATGSSRLPAEVFQASRHNLQ
jgi:hypothetical protein